METPPHTPERDTAPPPTRKLPIWAEGLLLFVALLVLVAFLQFSTPDLIGNDGYYHIKVAYLMRTEGLRLDFDWLELTILNSEDYTDHHFLYHAFMMPFTFGDLRLGAKWAATVLPSLSFMAVWVLLRGQKVKYAALWTLAILAISEGFLYRMVMPRAQAMSVGTLVLATHFVIAKQYRYLLPLAAFYVWLYNAFPLILIVVGVYTALLWALEKEWNWQPLAFTGGGVALGLVVNPYFPQNFIFVFKHILPKVNDPVSIDVGFEWYPWDTTQILDNSWIGLSLLLLGIFALGLRDKKMSLPTATTLALTFIFGAMFFQSRRFVEYFAPFAMLFSILSLSALVKPWLEDNEGIFDIKVPNFSLTMARRGVVASLLILALTPTVYITLSGTAASAQKNQDYRRYADANAWLIENTEPGERIFQSDWDDFPQLFFYNHYNAWTLGLDSTYTQLFDQELYDIWWNISEGYYENPAQEILERFDARYAFTDHKHPGFIELAENDPQMTEVYQDDYAIIYYIEE